MANMFEIVGTTERPFFANGLIGNDGMIVVQKHVRLVEIGFTQRIALGRKPIGAFPAEYTAKHRPQRLHSVIAWRTPQCAARFTLFIRIVHGEDLGIGFLVLLNQEAAASIIAKAARIDAHHVYRRFTIDNPMCQLPTCATCGGNAKTVAFVEPEVFQTPCRSDNRRPVGRICDCAIIHALDANLAKGWHALHGGEDIGLKPFKRVGEQFIFTRCRRTINIAGRRTQFIWPQQQPARFLTHIIAGVGFAQDAHFGQSRFFARHDVRMLLGHDILMLDRDHRDIEAHHGTCLTRKIAGAGNDMLARDIALIRRDKPFAVRLLRDRGDCCVAINGRAALPRALRQCLREIGGLNITVIGMLDRANDAVHVGKRPNIFYVVGAQEIDIDANGTRNACIIIILIHPVFGGRQPDVRDLRKTGMQAGLCL